MWAYSNGIFNCEYIIMSYDLVLSRINHDMQFSPIKMPDGATHYSFWPFEGADRVAQQIKINLLSFLGEWFLDTGYGVPYLQDIMIKNPKMSSVESILRSHINSIPDVKRIDSLILEWDRKARTLGVTFSVDTELGPIKESYKLELIPRNQTLSTRRAARV